MAKKNKEKAPRLTKKTALKQLLELFESNPGTTFEVKDLFPILKAKNHPAKMLVMDALQELVLDDYLTTDGKGRYTSATRSNVMEGTFRRKRNGRNSFVPDDGGKSILVCERNSLGALDGDRVRVTMLARRQGHTREAEVTEIIKRAHDQFVGTVQVERGYGFLVSESRALATDIFIPKENLGAAKNGDKAVVKITDWPKGSKSPVGKVIDVLGRPGDNQTEMHAILAEYGLPYKYPQSVERAAERLDPGITPEEIARREDFRSVTTFTIDPHDAKDFDDALSLRKLSDGTWEVGVHIADVSHYVQEGDIIDREAQKRATSVYLVDRTIPMLPERLCNFICSLRPDEEKLAYSTIFKMNARGEVLSWHLAHTVIKSDRRFTYEEVQTILERNRAASEEDLALPGEHPEPLPEGAPLEGEYAEELVTLNRLAKLLRQKRFKNGAIGFDRAEVRFEIDEKGHPVSTYVKVAKDANKLVEEFMLLANRSVAEFVAGTGKTFVYRIHDLPNLEKLEGLRNFAKGFGYKMAKDPDGVKSAVVINKLLSDSEGKPEGAAFREIALRSMAKAKYSTDNIGHFGLAFANYTHFTSPIRRYPDLMVHRLLALYLENGKSQDKQYYQEQCDHASLRENVATEAERTSIKYKLVEYMQDHLGEEYDGTISGVTEWGMYVQVEPTKIEGMVSLRDIKTDFFEFEEEKYRLRGRRTHKIYRLGDAVRVRVTRANLEQRLLDFELVTEEQ